MCARVRVAGGGGRAARDGTGAPIHSKPAAAAAAAATRTHAHTNVFTRTHTCTHAQADARRLHACYTTTVRSRALRVQYLYDIILLNRRRRANAITRDFSRSHLEDVVVNKHASLPHTVYVRINRRFSSDPYCTRAYDLAGTIIFNVLMMINDKILFDLAVENVCFSN